MANKLTKAERLQRIQKLCQVREMESQRNALRQIRDNPQAAPETRLEAVKMLEEMEKGPL